MTSENHEERPREMPAVKTTIVGGRPPGAGKEIGRIPHGMEILIKKAAVDPAFRELLLARRAEAAREIDLELEPAEAAMLNSVPAEQLEAIIANTKVSDEARRALLGKVAVAALGAAAVAAILLPSLGIRPDRFLDSTGISPDRPPAAWPEQGQQDASPASQPAPPATRGISPDRP